MNLADFCSIMSGKKELKVYIVDDDPVYVFGLQKMIKINKYSNSVVNFQNGLEALNRLKADIESNDTLPDLILLDINMPVMDGWQFLEEFARNEGLVAKNITIHMVSSSIEDADRQRALSYSLINQYIAKPLTANKLAEIFGVSNGVSLKA